MNILSADQTRLADSYTIEYEPISSIQLMERASARFVDAFLDFHIVDEPIAIICGNGNNGGDGLAISRILLGKGHKVHPYVIQPKSGTGSADFEINLSRLRELTTVAIISHSAEMPDLSGYKIIIDAIFGSGLNRVVSGFYGEVIAQMNNSGAHIVAVDIPSGLFADQNTPSQYITKANITISFQAPKLAFFMPDCFAYVGNWLIIDIGLDEAFIQSQQSNYLTLDENSVSSLLPRRGKFDHKGKFGHGQLIGGSYGKIGAMVLAARAFLSSGAGLLTLSVPSVGINILQTAVPEAMCAVQKGEKIITDFSAIQNVTAIGIGPGLGQEKETIKAFADFLRTNNTPLVLDADALNILSNHRELLSLLPEQTIITPHVKEFERLVGHCDNHWQRIEKAIDFAEKWQLVIVLKGAHTAIINNGKVFFNTTGNPGMATAGSGDVLLGIITSLRAQQMVPLDAAMAGVYIHGLAGDHAAEKKGQISLIASDLIESLPEAFCSFKRNL